MNGHTPPKKSLGQHFLMHRQTAERMVGAAGITPQDTVLEIGPGTGLLTKALLSEAGHVVAVEADHELIPRLNELFARDIEEGTLEVREQDIRTFDPATLNGPYKLVANIPYYITGEIFRQFLTSTHKPSSLTLLIQKEVAERIARSKKESLLSLSIKAYGTPKYCFTVPKGAFVPAPKIDSAVLTIGNIQSPFLSNGNEDRFFELLHAGFGHKRKQLGKNLEDLISTNKLQQILESHGLTPSIRAEDVPLEVWFDLSKN